MGYSLFNIQNRRADVPVFITYTIITCNLLISASIVALIVGDIFCLFTASLRIWLSDRVCMTKFVEDFVS